MEDKNEIAKLKAALKITTDALEGYCALPLPLDEMPNMTVKQALETFADRIKIARNALQASKAITEVKSGLLEEFKHQNLALLIENTTLKEALEEFTKPPHKDSDLRSFIEWINTRARYLLGK